MSETLMLQEAFELQHLQNNGSLLEYGLRTGLIGAVSDSYMFIDQLNIKLMSQSQIVSLVLLELLVRLGVFVSTTGLVKLCIDPIHEDDRAREGGLKVLYVLAMVTHQTLNFNTFSIRTVNRLLMSLAIILFSLTTFTERSCKDMERFKHRIGRRLSIDYYMWCTMFAMGLVLTCSSPIHINLEYEYGHESHIVLVIITLICASSLGSRMMLIGQGRLSPLILGTPMVFLDAGDYITIVKAIILFIYYIGFWSLDWREAVDWNHAMICQSGVCRLLSKQAGTYEELRKAASSKFDMWRMSEGLDDDGWFILLDPTSSTHDDASPESRSSEEETNSDHDQAEDQQEASEQQQQQQQQTDNEEEDDDDEHIDALLNDLNERDHLVLRASRVIYLQSRHPLLTSLAALMLLVWE